MFLPERKAAGARVRARPSNHGIVSFIRISMCPGDMTVAEVLPVSGSSGSQGVSFAAYADVPGTRIHLCPWL